MKLNLKAFALTCGIFWGVSMFLMTLWVVNLGSGYNALLESFRSFYIGYTISNVGSVLGLIHGFLDGLIGGAIFVWIYNKLVK